MTAAKCDHHRVLDTPDYIIETREEIEAEIVRREERARNARAEEEHARGVSGLEGPASAASAEAERVETEIADLREVGDRIEQGYPYWERVGFEGALDAVGEAWRWELLSEAVAPSLTYGHEEAEVRIPIDAQRAYERALASGLFDRFELCSAFETEGDEVVAATHYLFGMRDLATMSATFLVANW